MLRSFDGVLPLSAGDPARPTLGIVLILMQHRKPNAKPPCCLCALGEEQQLDPPTHLKHTYKKIESLLPFHRGLFSDFFIYIFF